MAILNRAKNRLLARVFTRFPRLAEKFIERAETATHLSGAASWAPVAKPLEASRIAVVTTAGIHHLDQEPFDMKDPEGDPSFREIYITRPRDTLRITHDYYDHTDAEKDINIVLPLDRLMEMAEEGRIGSLADTNYSFMGHINEKHIPTLVKESSPEVARRLKDDNVDAVLLTPA